MKSKLLVTAVVLVCVQALIVNASDEVAFITQWGTPGYGPGQFQSLRELGVDADDNIYAVDDVSRGRVQVFSSEGLLLTSFGTGYCNHINGVSIDSANMVYLSDDLGRRIVKFQRYVSHLGALTFAFRGSYGIGQYPYKTAIDADDNLLIGEYWARRVRKFAPSGQPLLQLPGPDYVPYSTTGQSFNLPISVAVDPEGNIYVTEHDSPGFVNGRAVVKFDADGLYLKKWELGGPITYYPVSHLTHGISDIAIDQTGFVYLSTNHQHRVEVFTTEGLYLGWFGRGDVTTGWHGAQSTEVSLAGAGPGEFDQPYSVLVDHDGFVYVGDLGNSRIQKFAVDISTDFDGDGWDIEDDNCPTTFNPDQSDLDGDGFGDVCDNCPMTSNGDQSDSDGDGDGDECDPDDDGDGVADLSDNCPNTPNPDQADLDGDFIGDACDTDNDNDGVDDEEDNCPWTPNPDQVDVDGDSIGDACDTDRDNDGVDDEDDICPDAADPLQLESDGDGIGDACDPCPLDPLDDGDGDGFCENVDNCADTYNLNQLDSDIQIITYGFDEALNSNGDAGGPAQYLNNGAALDPDKMVRFERRGATGAIVDGSGRLRLDRWGWTLGDRFGMVVKEPLPATYVISVDDLYRTTRSGYYAAVSITYSKDDSIPLLDRDLFPTTASEAYKFRIIPNGHYAYWGRFLVNVEYVDQEGVLWGWNGTAWQSGGYGLYVLQSGFGADTPLRHEIIKDENGYRGRITRLDTPSPTVLVETTPVPAYNVVAQGLSDYSSIGSHRWWIYYSSTNYLDDWIFPRSDGHGDVCDNCTLDFNPDQIDSDNDLIGDVCDPCPDDPRNDPDDDGVCYGDDNCPETPNADQSDDDDDLLGDVCDPCPADPRNDTDEDGVCYGEDNCPDTPNPGQEDLDGDGEGDVCDEDDDGDGVLDVNDNCPMTANADQADNDADGVGDACDPDDDNDGVPDADDNCPMTANTDQADNDGDGQGDACDDDDDNDGVLDGADNCPMTANTDQADNDGDGQGDACDDDDDNDGVLDGVDNCPLISNPDQADLDGDGQGDACDEDDDNDGVPDVVDNCPRMPNADQSDFDGDSIGDACDPDIDNDGVLNLIDACDYEYAPTDRDANVDGCIDAVDDFAAVVLNLSITDPDVVQGLLDTIAAAGKSIGKGKFETASNQLNAFINKVEAQRGKAIAEADADMLINFALNIIASFP